MTNEHLERIKELEQCAIELFDLVHDSDLILHKMRANELYDIIKTQPEPLDPKTCELMVGDVVLFHGKELVVQRIKGGDIYAASSISIHGYTRDELTLKSNQRAGVQIETK